MDALKERILKDGHALNEDVLLVDSFLNHQVDPALMQQIGKEFARLFADAGVTKVVTIEASGIAPALMTALELGVELVVFKKSMSAILNDELLETPVHSFTKGNTYKLTCKKRFLSENDAILFIDDFLATGDAGLGVARLVKMAGARIVGIGCVIEKAFQHGREKLEAEGYHVEALASVAKMGLNTVEFTD